MKKLFFLSVFALLFINCNNDDDSKTADENPTDKTVLIKKVTNTSLADSDGTTETFVMEFGYNEDKKLNKIILSNGYFTDLIYENNQLVGYASYEGGVLQSDGNLYYENNKVKYSIARDGDYVFRIDYSYLNDGKLKVTTCSGTEPCVKSNNYSEFTYDDNNITQEVRSHTIFGEPSEITYNYSFDDKKNPLENYDEPVRILLRDMFNSALSANNYILQTDYAGSLINYANTYTEDGYLKYHEGKYETTGDLYVSYEYEYIEL